MVNKEKRKELMIDLIDENSVIKEGIK